ncbi:SMI1/KNR4 family protein [Streptomyces paludis]|uniref:SMI1/KNR4 family protein n=1 Tax=Streptomyces paludis TaxID=2282738 RepID=A0A345HT07_9ACTN|nr:SMI1/KNR4 family protein [Streptomyces paludis]AXG79831.1 SMI1/KNR4 family protein [Streptomyces paludis]
MSIDVSPDDRRFPPALVAMSEVEFDYDDGHGIDYEPFAAFRTAEDTTDWIRAWTGNPLLSGDAFRPFGQDGTGGYAALWLVRAGRGLVEQPVVFLGSEGDVGVVARDLDSFLWLLADGLGPCEAVEQRGGDARPVPRLLALAERFAVGPRRSAREVMEEAAREFPRFEEEILALCR